MAQSARAVASLGRGGMRVIGRAFLGMALAACGGDVVGPKPLPLASVSAGNGHACGITPTGAPYCWGYNGYGDLGNGATSHSATPVAVSGGLTFVAVSAGGTHTCGVTPAGAGYCWGYNVYGELGDSTRTDSKTPVPVSGGLTFATVSSGQVHTCAVTTGGAAYCWGFNFDGQLGDG